MDDPLLRRLSIIFYGVLHIIETPSYNHHHICKGCGARDAGKEIGAKRWRQSRLRAAKASALVRRKLSTNHVLTKMMHFMKKVGQRQ